MKNHIWMPLAVAIGILVASHPTHAQNTPITRFWLSETITGTTTGPISSTPGTRFETAHGKWIILTSPPGQILFSDADSGEHYGPYGFQPQRIILLGEKAMLFAKIEGSTVLTMPSRTQSLTELPASPPASTTPQADAPKGWERQPTPSTNPGDHLNRPRDFSLESRKYPGALEIWFEPLHSVKYDWSLGGYSGNSGQKLESSRIGASGIWRNFFLEAAMINDAKIGGSIVPDGTRLSDLNLDDGSGFSLSGGYVYSFVIDENWNASFGGFVQFERTSFDMNATVLTRGGEIIPPSTDSEPGDDTVTHSYAFKTHKSSLRMQETKLGAFGGIDYLTPVWEQASI